MAHHSEDGKEPDGARSPTLPQGMQGDTLAEVAWQIKSIRDHVQYLQFLDSGHDSLAL